MVVHPLSVMMFATRNDIADISTLHSIVAVIYHKLICRIQMTFIVTNRSGCLVMHHQLYSFWLRICIQHFQIEIRIRCNEIKYIIFWFAEPIFPTFVPSFYQYLIKSMFRSKVNVPFHIIVIRCMASVRFCFWIICFAQFHRVNIVRICPRTFSANHFPPHTNVFHRFNPRNIFISTRIVQIQCQLRCQNITRIITHDYRAPRRTTRCLHISFISLWVRCQPRFKNQVPIIKVQMHTGIINQSSFMQVDI